MEGGSNDSNSTRGYLETRKGTDMNLALLLRILKIAVALLEKFIQDSGPFGRSLEVESKVAELEELVK